MQGLTNPELDTGLNRSLAWSNADIISQLWAVSCKQLRVVTEAGLSSGIVHIEEIPSRVILWRSKTWWTVRRICVAISTWCLRSHSSICQQIYYYTVQWNHPLPDITWKSVHHLAKQYRTSWIHIPPIEHHPWPHTTWSVDGLYQVVWSPCPWLHAVWNFIQDLVPYRSLSSSHQAVWRLLHDFTSPQAHSPNM